MFNLHGILAGAVMLLGFMPNPAPAVVLLGYGVFCGMLFTAIYALIKGSRSQALTSLVLTIPPFCGFVFGLWRRLPDRDFSWMTIIWAVGLACSVAAMIGAYWPRWQTAPAEPPAQDVPMEVLPVPALSLKDTPALMLLGSLVWAMMLFFCCSGLMFPYVPIDRSLEKKIKPGMTQTEVKAILGPPHEAGGFH